MYGSSCQCVAGIKNADAWIQTRPFQRYIDGEVDTHACGLNAALHTGTGVSMTM